MKITVEKIKILGITIPTNGKYEDLIKLNYDEKKVKIKNIIQSWSKRSLTLFGKVTIIKSLIVPQLTYLLSVLPNPGQVGIVIPNIFIISTVIFIPGEKLCVQISMALIPIYYN
jgi:hypothetical protein